MSIAGFMSILFVDDLQVKSCDIWCVVFTRLAFCIQKGIFHQRLAFLNRSSEQWDVNSPWIALYNIVSLCTDAKIWRWPFLSSVIHGHVHGGTFCHDLRLCMSCDVAACFNLSSVQQCEAFIIINLPLPHDFMSFGCVYVSLHDRQTDRYSRRARQGHAWI